MRSIVLLFVGCFFMTVSWNIPIHGTHMEKNLIPAALTGLVGFVALSAFLFVFAKSLVGRKRPEGSENDR